MVTLLPQFFPKAGIIRMKCHTHSCSISLSTEALDMHKYVTFNQECKHTHRSVNISNNWQKRRLSLSCILDGFTIQSVGTRPIPPTGFSSSGVTQCSIVFFHEKLSVVSNWCSFFSVCRNVLHNPIQHLLWGPFLNSNVWHCYMDIFIYNNIHCILFHREWL